MILVFVSADDARYQAARALVNDLKLAGYKRVALVDKRSSALEDLLRIARYGVVEPCVVIVADGDQVRLRLKRLLSLEDLAELLGAPTE